jgi:hypothetical protein
MTCRDHEATKITKEHEEEKDWSWLHLFLHALDAQ